MVVLATVVLAGLVAAVAAAVLKSPQREQTTAGQLERTLERIESEARRARQLAARGH
jgi:hypothetical protein